MKNYKIIADPRVEYDLMDAIDFLESRKKGLRKFFLNEYRNSLKTLQKVTYNNPRYEDVYCLPMKKIKYMIHFQTDYSNNIIIIRAIISTYKDPNRNWIYKK